MSVDIGVVGGHRAKSVDGVWNGLDQSEENEYAARDPNPQWAFYRRPRSLRLRGLGLALGLAIRARG